MDLNWAPPLRRLAAVLLCIAALPRPACAAAAEDYARAQRFLPDNEQTYVRNGSIQTHWIGTSDSLWYERTNENGDREFIVVEAATGEKRPAFDQKALAAALSHESGKAVDGAKLPFATFSFTSGNSIEFVAFGAVWSCGGRSMTCQKIVERAPASFESLSPDHQWVVYLDHFNLRIRPVRGGPSRALTTDGSEFNGYATFPGDSTDTVTSLRTGTRLPAIVLWSPDSRRIITCKLDERAVRNLYLIASTPEDHSSRPKLYSYRYALPGDRAIPLEHPLVIDIATGRRMFLATKPLEGSLLPAIARGYMWWSSDCQHLYFLRRDRYSKWIALNEADVRSGIVGEVLRESSTTWVRDSYQNDFSPTLVRTLANGEIIWMSDRDGWAQLYRYGRDGRLINRVTQGPWTVRDIVHVDEARRLIYFTASGVDAARNPYDEYVYKVGFDGSNLRLLTPEEGEHVSTSAPVSTADPSQLELSQFSRSGRFFVDTITDPATPADVVLRSSDGRIIVRLEQADVSKLREGGFRPPETFKALAADGKTDIYGLIYRPSNFDPSKKYPVVDAIYAGAQSTRLDRTFNSAVFDVFQAQAVAELGFVVVAMDGRGTPQRSRAFWDHVYLAPQNASDVDDHVAAIKQLGERYTYLDLQNVGIYGASGGGYGAALGILRHPDFYKVAVSAEGAHDLTLYITVWGERYIGDYATHRAQYLAASVEPLASRLSGKLLLIHGELDDNVPPSETLRLAASLIAADKDFDYLIIPNGNHDAFASSPYQIRRTWDYLVRNLRHEEPPSAPGAEVPK